jgi:hypothetical protein
VKLRYTLRGAAELDKILADLAQISPQGARRRAGRFLPWKNTNRAMMWSSRRFNPDRMGRAWRTRRARFGAKKFGEMSFFDLEPRNPLKFHKTAKTLFGKAWPCGHGYL